MSGTKPDDIPAADELRPEDDGADGFWINADPIPGCVVCNIGESEWLVRLIYAKPGYLR